MCSFLVMILVLVKTAQWDPFVLVQRIHTVPSLFLFAFLFGIHFGACQQCWLHIPIYGANSWDNSRQMRTQEESKGEVVEECCHVDTVIKV